jgi:GDSL-like Lipase/Acylhydrolase family
MNSTRGHAVIRDAVIVILIVAGLFVAIEGAVRTFWPQKLETDYLGGPSIALHDERLGFRLRPDARSTVTGPEYAVGYQISEQGLRDEVHHALPKPPGTTRVLVLGDSFAYGTGNAYDDIWPVLFEQAVQVDGHAIEVVKAGVPAYDTRTEVLYLEKMFSTFDPDIVLLTFLPNDLFTNMPADADLAGHEPPTEGIGEKGADLHSVILAKRVLMANDWLYGKLYVMTKRREYFVSPPTPAVRGQIEITKALLERAQAFCRTKGCELAVLSIPQQFQVLVPGRGETLGVDVDLIDDEFAAFAERQGFTWLSALPSLRTVYQNEGEDLFYRFDGHLTKRGNRAVAEFLVSALVARFGDLLQQPQPIPAGDV